MVKNLKEALQAYRQASTKEEKEDVLYHVYDTKIIEEMNAYDKEPDKIVQLRFKIKSMNKVHNYINKLYSGIHRRDLDSYVLVAVWKIFDEREIDFSLTDRQIEVWFFKALSGLINNQIKAEREKQKLNVPEHIVYKENNNGDASLYDQVALRKYNDEHIQSSYDLFVEAIGGYEEILSKPQLVPFTLKRAGFTEQAIADKLGCSQQNINNLLKAANKRIREKYIDYKLTQIAHKSPNTITIIENHIHNYNNIIHCGDIDKFDFFKYTYKFLQENYKFYNEHNDKSYTVMDVIFDNLRKQEHDLFKDVVASFTSDKITFTSRQKDRVVNIVNRILNQYIKDTYKAAGNIARHVTHNNLIVEKLYKM
ncbi:MULTISPECIES: hypothetical protein [Lysinibacillus]|uniref:hypothetical protein n=1 Tax=Lysinibacillus TaxID=400634 RepID=UPI0021A5F0B9|nr:hypothetical protein [Lysinibacillus capsici]MCT1538429.1 hypothetical protein [Lysinibacillus capsici]MCT1569137.1 hypothetical protein [Lysinibacillus capsici]MCT1646152.1 hypothetical protein [Lysinibacillus capsici]MCT1725342.1 hypothetical protein [Lysinibacillus capsici]MCT1784122.1 hypothetical protein [Lysinibacillus capsici]